MNYPDFSYEEELIDKGYIPCGTDEVGYGCLAYDVTVASVIVPIKSVSQLEGKVKDSKKLSKKIREELSKLILDLCICSVYSVSNEIIDQINILEATKVGIYNSVKNLNACDYALIDGSMSLNGLKIPHTNLIKGDTKSISIACASIIAKVDRDRRMKKIAELYPQYGFDTNSGYGTVAGRKAIVKYGVTPVHRKTFKRVKEFV